MLNTQSLSVAVSRRLLILNIANIALGVILRRSHKNKTLQGIAEQNIAWGAINCGIALVGGAASRNSKMNVHTLKRILWINAGLDVIYMLGGAVLAARSDDRPRRRGTGIGIIFQGALLFLFDLFHAAR
jgi:ABC-type microcin C transport system duplicated ATPase subunit YejF